jgi:D-sedoheptulose 7-phosphate isomerase
MKRKIIDIINESIDVKKALQKDQIGNIAAAAELIIESIRKGGKLLVFGNGGSAADSQHIVAELVGRFKKERAALAAIALTTNTSTITALGNDYGYDATFSRQVEALGREGDVALGISTSGNSKNVIAAIRMAKKLGLKTIALTGSGGLLKGESDIAITVKASSTPRIQESHLMIGHIICEMVEEGIFKT